MTDSERLNALYTIRCTSVRKQHYDLTDWARNLERVTPGFNLYTAVIIADITEISSTLQKNIVLLLDQYFIEKNGN